MHDELFFYFFARMCVAFICHLKQNIINNKVIRHINEKFDMIEKRTKLIYQNLNHNKNKSFFSLGKIISMQK